jgi:uncharacterized protein YecE (DUF72 family)
MIEQSFPVYVGTSGYSYRDWVGPVYPPGTPSGRFLQVYSEQFNFVELNFPYYRNPDTGMIIGFRDGTPDNFRFSIKAPGTMTHTEDPASVDIPGVATAFLETLKPLHEAGKLAGILVQLPYRFHYTRHNRKRLAEICDSLSGYPVFLEFRNRDWSRTEVWAEMNSRGVHWVIPDLPALSGLPRPEPVITGEIGYFRFHGRNTGTWWNGTVVTRYLYKYSRNELSEAAALVRHVASETRTVYVAFNNHASGHAATNARVLLEMISTN